MPGEEEFEDVAGEAAESVEELLKKLIQEQQATRQQAADLAEQSAESARVAKEEAKAATSVWGQFKSTSKSYLVKGLITVAALSSGIFYLYEYGKIAVKTWEREQNAQAQILKNEAIRKAMQEGKPITGDPVISDLDATTNTTWFTIHHLGNLLHGWTYFKQKLAEDIDTDVARANATQAVGPANQWKTIKDGFDNLYNGISVPAAMPSPRPSTPAAGPSSPPGGAERSAPVENGEPPLFQPGGSIIQPDGTEIKIQPNGKTTSDTSNDHSLLIEPEIPDQKPIDPNNDKPVLAYSAPPGLPPMGGVMMPPRNSMRVETAKVTPPVPANTDTPPAADANSSKNHHSALWAGVGMLALTLMKSKPASAGDFVKQSVGQSAGFSFGSAFKDNVEIQLLYAAATGAIEFGQQLIGGASAGVAFKEAAKTACKTNDLGKVALAFHHGDRRQVVISASRFAGSLVGQMIGSAVGTALLSETGPGAVVGKWVGGVAGFMGGQWAGGKFGEWIADRMGWEETPSPAQPAPKAVPQLRLQIA